MRGVLLCLFSLCWTFTFAQTEINKHNATAIDSDSVFMNKEFRPSGGNCYVVLELLRASQRSDSIAVAIFKEEYELIDMPLYLKKQLLEQNQLNIIHFFALENNKKYKCKSKVFKGIVPVLLVE